MPLDAPNPLRWQLRDWLAAAVLFAATAATVLYQNAHVAVLWDISYMLDSAYRFAIAPQTGQLPYRDLPFVHAPLTFLIQAAIIRLTGRVFLHHVLYAATVSGVATLLTWRILLRTLNAWLPALLLAAPLTVLGIYGIFPTPIYDCDAILFLLIAVYLLQRTASTTIHANRWAVAAGCASVLPVFVKQNIGLPFLLILYLGIAALLLQHRHNQPTIKTLITIVLAATFTLLAALILIAATVGLHNYLYWTITFAGQRRLPGLADMLAIYRAPSLLWTLPSIAAGTALLLVFRRHPRTQRRTPAFRPLPRWTPYLAITLLAAPFAPPLFTLLTTTDPEDRAYSLLALWPLLLVLAIAYILWSLRRPTLTTVLLLAVLAAIHGTLLSQQLWRSTYALWPLFILLLAHLLAALQIPSRAITTFAAIAAFTLLLCGGLYTFSEDRLSYAQLPDTPPTHATTPTLRGLSTPGPYIPAFEQLLAFAAREIPANDAILLLPGEDPFYYATGRSPRFPVLLFDPTTDPYSPTQLLAAARTHNVRWLIVKRTLQLTFTTLPDPEQTLSILTQDFTLYRQLDAYDIYRRP